MEAYRITQLDGLRGMAAIMVLALHFPLTDSFMTGNFFVRQSWLFVDFFFVLSGFIIAKNYYNKIDGWASFKRYIIKRMARLLPLLYFTVLICFLYQIIGLFFGLKTEPQSLSFYLLQTLDSLCFLNSTTLLGDSQGMNPPSWSISAEMISYVVFPLGMMIFDKRKFIAVILIVAFCVLFMIVKDDFAFQNGDYGFVRGLLGFNLGILTYMISENKSFRTNVLEFPAVILILLAFYMTYNYKGDFRNVQYVILPFVFSIVIFVFRFGTGFVSKVLNSRMLQMLGRLSYSIYLNHYLVLLIVYQISFNILRIESSEFNISLILLLSIIIVVVVSKVTYEYIEMKIGERIRSILLRRP